MVKRIRVPQTVAKLLQAASNVRSRGEIHWSNSKGKYVKANNRTVADEAQVLRFLEQHPDQTTWERAIKHLGPGVPRPAAMLPQASASAQVNIDQLVAQIEQYKAGADRNAQAMLDQGQKVLDGLAPVSQLIDDVQQIQSRLELSEQRSTADIGGIKEDIRQLQDHFQELKDKFGQTNDETLAQAIAFDKDLIARLERIQQQLDNLQGLREEIQRMQSEGMFNQTLIPAVSNYPVWGYTFAAVLVAIAAGLLVTYLAGRNDDQWLNIPFPDIVWGLVAGAALFAALFVLIWSEAEADINVRTNASRGG